MKHMVNAIAIMLLLNILISQMKLRMFAVINMVESKQIKHIIK